VIYLLLCVGLAMADATTDLTMASSKDLPDTERMAAFERLVRLGATDMLVVSEVSVDDAADARKRWVAIRALGKIRGDRSKELLNRLIDDPMPAIRTAAAGAMGDFGEEAFVVKLNKKLADPAVIVRAAVAEAVGKIGNDSSVSPLSDALDHRRSYFRGRSLWVRRYYVDALGAIGDKGAYPALLRSLSDKDETVIVAAVEALERITGFDFTKGRSKEKEREAWRRWVSTQLRQ
jgi:HEAT repeat protein